MQLAAQGISPGASAGRKMLEEGSSFGVSQSMESARLKHVDEAELAQTIAKLGFVAEASVHLGLPRQTSFIRDQNTAGASVFLKLLGGRTLEQAQATALHVAGQNVASILHQLSQMGRFPSRSCTDVKHALSRLHLT